MPRIFDVSDWSEQSWYMTAGTRDKKVYHSPTGEQYFFKRSLLKENKHYKFEFWSEIIASEIGHHSGFTVLPYHIGIKDSHVGCISKSMIDPDREMLVQGSSYIQSFDPTFNTEDYESRKRYNFKLITSTLQSLHLESFTNNIVEMIVFDALIGNSDRHQENWAFIKEHSDLSKTLDEVRRTADDSGIFSEMKRRFRNTFLDRKKNLKPEFSNIDVVLGKNFRFAPIYDSGCSFGRELTDARVSLLLSDKSHLEKYVQKGLSEIHWDRKKVSHFELVRNLQEMPLYRDVVNDTLKKLVAHFDASIAESLIFSVDSQLSANYNSAKIPEERKELICKLVLSRFEILKGLKH